MIAVIFDSRVEDVLKAMFSHEEVGKAADTFENRVFQVLVTPDEF